MAAPPKTTTRQPVYPNFQPSYGKYATFVSVDQPMLANIGFSFHCSTFRKKGFPPAMMIDLRSTLVGRPFLKPRRTASTTTPPPPRAFVAALFSPNLAASEISKT